MKTAQDLQENKFGAVTFSETILLQFVLSRFQATLMSFFNMVFHAYQTIKEPNRIKQLLVIPGFQSNLKTPTKVTCIP